MTAFIKYNLKKLFSLTHLFLIFIYCSFAWFLGDPHLDMLSIYNSLKLTGKYDIVLYSVVLLNFILFINIHFRNELKKDRRDNISLRLTNREILWGLTFCYLIYFLAGFVVPIYGTALIQQLYYAPGNVSILVFVIKIICGITGYTIFWITISLLLNIRFRNDTGVLLLFSIIYTASFIVNFLTKGLLFDQFWMIENVSNRAVIILAVYKGLAWLGFILLSILIINRISKSLNNIDLSLPYRKGIFSKTAEKLKAYLSMYHYNMIGLSNQRILTFFSFIGLIFIIALVQIKTADLLVMGNLYVGVFVPVMFSLNQYHLIKIDKDAGMVHNNFLRDLSYWKIIFNRWFILIIPQLIIAIIYTLILKVYVPQIQFSFFVYIILLNIFCSIFNLCISIFTQAGAAANLFLVFFIYLQLREDVQKVIVSNHFLNGINIYYDILHTGYKVEVKYIGLLVLTIGILVYSSKIFLSKIKYVDIENT